MVKKKKQKSIWPRFHVRSTGSIKMSEKARSTASSNLSPPSKGDIQRSMRRRMLEDNALDNNDYHATRPRTKYFLVNEPYVLNGLDCLLGNGA